MGFMDKVKAQATSLAEKAQEQAKAGQEKLSAIQAKRHSDALLLEIGGIVYSERVGRNQGGGEERIAALVSRLQAFEAEHGQVQITPADADPGATGSYVPGAAGTTGTGAAMPQPGASSVPTASPGGGIPTASPGGGIPTASYSSDAPGASNDESTPAEEG